MGYKLAMLVLASATSAILITFGVGAFAAVLGSGAIYATLSPEDRVGLRAMARHPLRAVFGEDAAEPED